MIGSMCRRMDSRLLRLLANPTSMLLGRQVCSQVVVRTRGPSGCKGTTSRVPSSAPTPPCPRPRVHDVYQQRRICGGLSDASARRRPRAAPRAGGQGRAHARVVERARRARQLRLFERLHIRDAYPCHLCAQAGAGGLFVGRAAAGQHPEREARAAHVLVELLGRRCGAGSGLRAAQRAHVLGQARLPKRRRVGDPHGHPPGFRRYCRAGYRQRKGPQPVGQPEHLHAAAAASLAPAPRGPARQLPRRAARAPIVPALPDSPRRPRPRLGRLSGRSAAAGAVHRPAGDLPSPSYCCRRRPAGVLHSAEAVVGLQDRAGAASGPAPG